MRKLPELKETAWGIGAILGVFSLIYLVGYYGELIAHIR